VRGFVDSLLQNAPNSEVEWVKIWAGEGPENCGPKISKVASTTLLHFLGCMAWSTSQTKHALLPNQMIT